MRAVVMTKHGGPDVLQVQQRPDPPPPGDGEITVEVAAAGVAFSEVAARVELYPPAPKPPRRAGHGHRRHGGRGR
jgi:NADPH:quinone reductase-like Zn-dependent oxidoreductase